jgi:hypothetical protein
MYAICNNDKNDNNDVVSANDANDEANDGAIEIIKQKGIFINSYDNSYENTKIENINTFLEKETITNKTESWNKLDKTGKIRLLNNYVDTLVVEHNLSLSDVSDLKKYLIDSLDKKKLQHVKDVQCDKITGKIISIPTLQFNGTTKKFTLKRAEKRVSTLKSLGKGKKHSPTSILNK